MHNKLYPGTAEKELRTIEVKPLDAVLRSKDIQSPALLKADVQGFEREALEGCKSLLACFSDVYIECSFVELYMGQALAHEVIDLLGRFGYALCGIFNLTSIKKVQQFKAIFTFRNKFSKIKCADIDHSPHYSLETSERKISEIFGGADFRYDQNVSDPHILSVQCYFQNMVDIR